MGKTKNDEAWEKLFDEHDILSKVNRNGHFIIDSEQIKKYRESRLMTKFEHSVNLPKLFKDNQISILPVTRRSYIIGHFENYQKVKYLNEKNIKQMSFPVFFESIDYNNIYSESAAINCANLVGIIEDLVNEEAFLTVSGRMTTDKFDFKIRTIGSSLYDVNVDRAQIEIDAGFETNNYFLLIEAKNTSVDDFLIRQLYYPYRYWQSQLKKEVIPIFMTYSNDVFSFFLYRFSKKNEYNSIELIEQKHYSIETDKIIKEDIYNIFKKAERAREPEIPFPQADSFFRVIDFMGLLYDDDMTKEELALNYEFDIHKRQFDYYINAARYLGLVERYESNTGETTYRLSDRGRNIMSKPRKVKNLLIAETIMEHEVFYKAMDIYFNKHRIPIKDEVVKIMKDCYVYNVNYPSTVERRAQTVIKWIEWIVSLTETNLFSQ